MLASCGDVIMLWVMRYIFLLGPFTFERMSTSPNPNPFDLTVVFQLFLAIVFFPLIALAWTELPQRSVVNVEPPSGVDPAIWQAFTGSLATTRPIIWSNHAQAIESGDPLIGSLR